MRAGRRAPGRVLLCLTMGVTLLGVACGPARSAAATTPRAADATCARFGALRDAFDAVGELSTKAETFATIDRAVSSFRRATAHAPEEIAADMRLLSSSLAELQTALKPFRAKLHKTRNAQQYATMVDPIQRAFAKWAADQDVEALGAAQTHVQTWVSEHCGIELGATEQTTTTTTASR
jgi:hypothetical protein